MDGNWDSYFARVNDNVASFFVNLDFTNVAPLLRLASLVEVRLTLLKPRADGLPDGDEFDTLNAVEDTICERVQETAEAAYVGRVSHSGVRDFFFYSANGEATDTAIRYAMTRFVGYQYEISERLDTEWDTYRKYLLPSERQRQVMANRCVFEARRKEGDSLTRPREIDHWAYFLNETARNEFVRRAKSLGYQMRSATDASESNREFGARIVRVDVPDASFDATTLELFDLAAELGGEYDGWESPVEKARQ